MIDAALLNRLRAWSADRPENAALLARAKDPSALAKIAAEVPIADAEILRATALEAARLIATKPATKLTAGGSKNRIAAFRAAAHLPEGPEPTVDPPKRFEVNLARHALTHLGPTDRLSDRHTTTLLQHTVFQTRAALQNIRRTKPVADPLSATNVAGSCGYGQAASTFHLEDAGVPPANVALHQSAFLVPGAFNHAFSVAHMPNGKSYLIDATFRQFFRAHPNENNTIGSPGRHMRANTAYQKIAWAILEHGFIELTDTVAEAYVYALSQGTKSDATADDLRTSSEHRGLDYNRAQVMPS